MTLMSLMTQATGLVCKKADFLRDDGVPAGHEIGELVLEARDVDLQAVRVVDEADFGADVVVGHAVAEAREVNAGEAVLKGAAREINPVIGRLQKFLDDRQATGHVPETMG